MKKYSIGLIIGFFSFAFAIESSAQLDIPEDNQMWRVRVNRKIDLKEKQNKGFLSHKKELTQLILDGISSGKLTVYQDDTFDPELTFTTEDALANIQAKKAEEVLPYDPNVSYDFGNIVRNPGTGKLMSFNGADGDFGGDINDTFLWVEIDETAVESANYPADAFSELEIVEDIIFDKVRSRLYYDIEGMGMKLSGAAIAVQNNLAEATSVTIGFFKFDELVALFRENPDYRWVNRYNPREWKTFEDAFLLRLFSGTIIKYENPDNDQIDQMFKTNYDAVLEMQRYEMYLFEKEHNLWEY